MSMQRTTWPEWWVALDESVRPAILAISATQARLEEACLHPHTYARLGQLQNIAYYNRTVQKGALIKSEGGIFTPNLDTQHPMSISADEARMQVLNWAQPYHQLRTLEYSKKVICLKLLEGVILGLHANNLFVSMASMRSAMEHIGQLNLLVRALASLPKPDDANGAIAAWGSYAGEVTKRLYATRIDWPNLTRGDFRRDKARRFEYRKSEYLADMEAADLLKGVDKLGSRVAGARLAYDVLSEFVHPNYGTVLSVTESVQLQKDRHGLDWQLRRIGLGFPGSMASEAKQVLVDTFLVFSETFCLFESLSEEVAGVSGRLLECVQTVVRQVLEADKTIFDRNEPCPCGGGKKLKKCCGPAGY